MKTKMKRLCVDVLIDLASGFCLTAAITASRFLPDSP